jgi:Chaperone of endosialidase
VAALLNNTEGQHNTATGSFALQSNTTGNLNTATGRSALFSNTTGTFNTANGMQALFFNTIGDGNTATGGLALSSNTTGDSNTANGVEALNSNTIGGQNTADGVDALRDNTSGNFNTATGFQALAGNTTGAGNTALGTFACSTVTTADGVTCIAHGGQNASNTTWIGNVFGTMTLSGTTAPVIVSNTGQLGTMSSSRRFKKEIKPMNKASEAILAFKPVTFHYKSDNTGAPQFGLIAEEVAEVNPDLVVRNSDGEIYTVRYDAVNAMLLNEFLKEHKKVEKLEATVADLAATVKEQAAHLQRVSAQLDNSVARVAVANR